MLKASLCARVLVLETLKLMCTVRYMYNCVVILQQNIVFVCVFNVCVDECNDVRACMCVFLRRPLCE